MVLLNHVTEHIISYCKGNTKCHCGSKHIIVSLPHLRTSGLLQSCASICRVFPKIFVLLVCNRGLELDS